MVDSIITDESIVIKSEEFDGQLVMSACEFEDTKINVGIVHEEEKLFLTDSGYTDHFPPTQTAGSNLNWTHLKQEEISCRKCPVIKEQLGSHKEVITYTCRECSYTCTKPITLRNHILSHTRKNLFPCMHCNLTCLTPSVLRKHAIIHSGEKNFMCMECGYECYKSWHLRHHIATHTKIKRFHCKLCGTSYTVQKYLRQHMKYCHPEEIPDGQLASICEVGITKLNVDLGKEDNVHMGDKLFPNVVCSYTEQFLQTHIEKSKLCSVNLNKKKVTCKNFYPPIVKDLEEEVTPYSCSECCYTCFTLENLRHHSLIHSVGRPLSCSDCSFTCNEPSTLRIHMMIHTGVRNFMCMECGYECNRSSNLKQHILTHTKIKHVKKWFHCMLCGTYTVKKYLRQHMSRCHSKELPHGKMALS